MPQIILDTNIAGSIVDRKLTKSSVAPVTLFPEDLLGCGPMTHIRFATQGAFNARTQCSPPAPFYQRTASGLMARSAFIADRYEAGDVGLPNGRGDFLDILVQTNIFLSRALAAQFPNLAPYNVSPLALYLPGGGTMTRRGSNWIGDVREGEILTVGVPRITPQVDICERVTGIKASTSVSYTVKDKFCVPQLIAQASVTMIIAGPDSPVVDTGFGTTAPGAAVIQNMYGQSRLDTLETQVSNAYTMPDDSLDSLGENGAAMAALLYTPLPFTLNMGPAPTQPGA